MNEWKETDIGRLPTDWDVQLIANLIEEKGISVGVMYPGPNIPNGIPLIRAGDISYNKIDDVVNYRISLQVNNLHKRTILQGGELLVVLVGNPGISSVVPKSKKGWNAARAIGVLNLKDKSEGRFISYALRHPTVKFNLLSSCNTSVQVTLNLKELKELQIPWPEKKFRDRITATLSSIDDKISLLQRQNKTLEQLAETVFRQWFVEEASGRPGVLADVIDLIYGKALKEETRTGTGFPVIGSSGIVGYHAEFLVKGPGIVIGRKGTLGKVTYLFDNFFPIDTTFFIKAKLTSPDLLYEYFLLKSLKLEEMNSDSAVPGLNRDIALSSEIVIPSQKRVDEFNTYATPLFDKLETNNNQIRTLTQLRDTLLPKLMSGVVRVKIKR